MSRGAGRPIRYSQAAMLLGLGLACAPSAVAVGPDDPPSQPLPGFADASRHAPDDPLYFVHLSNDAAPTVSLDALRPPAAGRPSIWSGFTHRSIKVIHYAAPLRVAQNEMTLNLEAPGAGRTIVSLELEF